MIRRLPTAAAVRWPQSQDLVGFTDKASAKGGGGYVYNKCEQNPFAEGC